MPSPLIVWPRYARLAPNVRWAASPRKHLLRLLEVAEHRVAEDLVAAALVVAGLRARFRPGIGQVDQLIRRRHRQPAQQHLVEQRKNGGVRPNAQRQRQRWRQR